MTRPKGISTRRLQRWVRECEAEVVEATAQGIASPQEMHDIVYRRDYWRERLTHRQTKEKAQNIAVVEGGDAQAPVASDYTTAVAR